VFVNVEIKNSPFDAGFDEDRTIVDQTLEELERFDSTDRILLTSFDTDAVKRGREIDQAIHCGLLLLEVVPLDPGVEIAAELALDAIVAHLDHLKDDPAARIGEIHRRGLAAVAWGVDVPEDVALLSAAGVDAVITDDPRMARRVIDQR
jgi:glycerophosphoryl diester phosphodiesterase